MLPHLLCFFDPCALLGELEGLPLVVPELHMSLEAAWLKVIMSSALLAFGFLIVIAESKQPGWNVFTCGFRLISAKKLILFRSRINVAGFYIT